MADETPLTVRCVVTGEEKEVRPLKGGAPRLPPGWKRLGGDFWSPKAWESKYVLRAARVPVASVVTGYEPESWSVAATTAGWKAFRAALRASWVAATRASNWAMTELAKSDNDPLVRTEKGEQLPPWSAPKDLYERARLAYPDLDSQSMGSLLQRARAKYKDVRWFVRVRASVSLPTFRYPVPLPVPDKDSPLTAAAGQPAFLRLRVAGEQFTARLAGGPDWRRAHALLQRVAAGELLRGELLLYEQAVPTGNFAGHGGARGNGSSRRRQPGANRSPTRVMAALSVWLPKQEVTGGQTLTVTTARDRLWLVSLEGRDEPWLLNEDHARRRIAAHNAVLQRLSDDAKLERRLPRKARGDLNSYRAGLCRRFAHWQDDFCKKAAAMLAGFAHRNRVGLVQYNDEETGWLPGFCWFKLRTLVGQKLAEFGITFEHAGASDAAEQPETLEGG